MSSEKFFSGVSPIWLNYYGVCVVVDVAVVVVVVVVVGAAVVVVGVMLKGRHPHQYIEDLQYVQEQSTHRSR